MDVDRATRTLIGELQGHADPERAIKEKLYLKSEVEHLGVSVPEIRRVAKRFAREHPDMSRRELKSLVKLLWAREVHELRMTAVELLDIRNDSLTATDLPFIGTLIRDAGTWALVDPLAINVAGRIVERSPETASTLDNWAADRDFWMRRAAMLTLLLPLRKGYGDFKRFFRYADAMLEESEFFIRKAIGWILREISKQHPDVTYHWIEPRAHIASGVTVREAVKYLSEEQKTKVMARYHR